LGNITFDPLDPRLFFFELIWFAIAGGLLLGAYRSKNEWMRATLASLALAIIGIRLLAVLPSWWLYFADTKMKWGGQGCATIDLQCVKQTIKDLVVVVENGAVLGAFVVGFLIYQRKFPKQLASGESKPEATGGYK